MSLFNALGNQPNQMNIFQQYKQFRENFKGDPNQIIQQKLQSGQITQQQLDQAKSMMAQFSKLFK